MRRQIADDRRGARGGHRDQALVVAGHDVGRVVRRPVSVSRARQRVPHLLVAGQRAHRQDERRIFVQEIDRDRHRIGRFR
jgi:hypothetical protein